MHTFGKSYFSEKFCNKILAICAYSGYYGDSHQVISDKICTCLVRVFEA